MFPIDSLVSRRPSWTALVLAVGLPFAAPTSAWAQTADTTPQPAPSSFREVHPTSVVRLTVQEGRLLRLPGAAANIMVANPDIASFQVPAPDSVFVFARATGQTTLYALDAGNNVIAAIKLIARYDTDALSAQAEAEVPGAEVRVVPAAGKGLIVRGTVRTPIDARNVMAAVRAAVDAEDEEGGSNGGGGGGGNGGGGGGGGGGNNADPPRVINQLKVELSAQVNIRVRVIEVARSLTHELGMNWDALIGGGDKFRLATGTTTTLFEEGASGAAGLLRQGSNMLGYSHDGLTGVLNALSEEGMATMLAEPNLTAKSGETAGFAAGGEVPIVLITNNNINIDYKSYGVILRMTPTLLSPNRISLRIAPEVSDLSEEGSVTLTSGSVIPALKVRRAETTIELASGQSFALAGMLRSNQSQQVNSVPGLKELPLLGHLFEREESQIEDTELVILATAYVVDPVTDGDLQMPGQGLPIIDAQLPPASNAGYLY